MAIKKSSTGDIKPKGWNPGFEVNRFTEELPTREPAPTGPITIPDDVQKEIDSLPKEMRDAAKAVYIVNAEKDIQHSAWLLEAFDLAERDANPIFKQMLWAVEDSLMNSFEELKGDYDAQAKRYEDRITQIQEDLVSGKEFLTMEQQSSLAQQAMTYEVKSEQIQETMANKGLSFSTNRKVANRRLDEYTENVAESTRRQYSKRISDLQKSSERGDMSAKDELAELERKMGEDFYKMGSEVEQQIGSENIMNIEGIEDYYKPTDGIIGGIESEYQADLDVRTDAYYDELSQKSFNPGSLA